MRNYEGGFWSKKYVIFAILLAVIITSVHLIAFTAGHSYTSDETHLQVMFANDSVLSGQPKWFGISSFITKVPFIYIARVFANYSRFGIFLPTLLVNIVCAILFMTGSIYFFKKYRYSRWSILPAIWVLTLGGNFITNLYLLNSRNFEIGVIFITLALIDNYLGNYYKISARKLILTASLMLPIWGLILVSDSYYLYMLFAPIMVCLGRAYYKTRAAKFKDILLLAVAGILMGALFYVIYKTLNYSNFPVPIRFDDYNNITLKISNLPFTLLNFTENSFFRNVIKPTTIAKLINSSLFILGFYGLIKIARDKELDSYEFIKILPILALFNIFVWLFSDRSSDHYFILLPFALSVGLAYLINKAEIYKWLITSLAILAVCANSGIIAKSYVRAQTSLIKPNKINYELVDKSRSLGLEKGYALFWDGPVNTYFAGNEIKFIQTLCFDNRLHLSHWYLTNTLVAEKAQKSFFMLNTDSPESCTKNIIIEQFGTPQQFVRYKNYQFYIYNYDIVEKMF